ncbi:MAG: translation initiation factor Sui1 [SAR324 cluster bacterium]|nr:translation initiation factor Sui1 [SAR324 cluster bacterium]
MATKKNEDGVLVYSTEHGSICPKCGTTLAKCKCSQKQEVARGDGIIRVGRSTKGRKGKGVTTVTGVPLGYQDLQKLAKQLKQKCGSGGTLKEGIIEIQGDHRELLIEELKKQGYTVKRSGG